MTSKDKTGDKLVASIRKSKAGTVAQKNSERVDAGEPEAKSPETKSKAPTTRSAATKSASAKPAPTRSAPKKSASSAAKNQERTNVYSHGCRVWPD